jgi:hypothetical protein
MPQVMESSLRQVGLRQFAMKVLCNCGAFKTSPNRCRKYQTSVDPSGPCPTSLICLNGPMTRQAVCDRARHRKTPAATLCLRFHQLEFAVEPLELFGYSQVAHLKINVLPSQTQSLTLS